MANQITDIDQVKSAASILDTKTTWDDVLGDWIEVAGDAFERRYHIPLTNTTFEDESYFDVDSGQLLNLQHGLVTELTSIVVYDTDDAYPTGVTLTPASDYRLEDSKAGIVKLMRLSAFIPVGMTEVMALVPTRWGRVDITYKAGFIQVPPSISRAAAELIAHWFDQYGGNQEVRSKAVGKISSIYYDYTKWPMSIKEVFAQYDTAAYGMVGII